MEKSGKKRLVNEILVVLGALLCFSCATKPKFEGTSEIVGRVADTKGKPLKNCVVVLDDTKSAATNNSGIFVFKDVKSGNHKVSVQKENYSMEEMSVPFYTRQTFLTLKCKNGKEVFSEVEDFLEQKDLESAKATLKMLKKCEANEKLCYFYEHLFEYLEKPSEKRLKNLTTIAKGGKK